MAFSCKIVLADRAKHDGHYMVYLQAIIDRKRAAVPIGFYVKPELFDARSNQVRATHPNSDTYNKELMKAVATGNAIASKFRLENKQLTPKLFKDEFNHPVDELDLIKFVRAELEIKKPTLAFNTIKQHNTVINKLESFRKKIRFGDLNADIMRDFKNKLIKDLNGPSTVDKILKIVKQYCEIALLRGHKFTDPFALIKIKTFQSNRLSLTQDELDKLIIYFDKADTPGNYKRLLQYFLFSCHTGLRISDIKAITWNNIHDNLLIFTPQKTKYNQLSVTVPLLEKDKKYLPVYKAGVIFKTYAYPVSNRYLKSIAGAVGIKKTITYHTSRHTFGSLFAEGGNIIALQKMMGHGDIKTTMGYVHTSTQNLIDAKNERYSKK